MKNNKFTNIPPLVENYVTVQDPLQKRNIFNDFFASKSSLNSPNYPAPNLNSINTSPIEIAKCIQNIKQ